MENKSFRLNIGTVIFGAIALYLVITFFIYLTSARVSSYLVTSGTLSNNENFFAVVLRDEDVVNASAEGYVNYYVQDGAKASKNDVVCSIGDEPGQLQSASLTASDLSRIRSLSSEFSKAYTPSAFHAVYEFKYSLNSSVANNTKSTAVTGTPVKSPGDGVVTFMTDGMEDLTFSDITDSTFDSSGYQSTQLQTDAMVGSGDPLYRLIRGNAWSIVFPVNDRQYAGLTSRSVVKVRFLKDGNSENGEIALFDKDNTHYVQLTFYSGMVRYRNDRYLDIELVMNTQHGLKIPISAIVTKEFYTIPVSFLSSGGEVGEAGFLKQVIDEEGEKTSSFIETELYEKTTLNDGTEVYYVDTAEFDKGDVLIKPDSRQTYTIGNVASLEGVYSTNRGYAIFRKISIIDQNDEFCIVESGTEYGISAYDYIVRDGTDVDESQILR